MIKDLHHTNFLLTYRHTGRKRFYMSKKFLKIIDNVCGCIIVTLCVINVIVISTHSNFITSETYSINQTAISFLFAMHVLIDQYAYKKDLQQKGEC